MEDILMEVADLWRVADETVRVGRGFEIDLEPLCTGWHKIDPAVNDVRCVPGIESDVDPAENLQRCETGIGVVDLPLIVERPRPDGVHVLEDPFLECEILVPCDADIPYRILPERLGAFGTLVPGVLVDDHPQVGGVLPGQSVRLEGIIVLCETEPPVSPHP